MGTNSSKKNIIQILENSASDKYIESSKIEYKFNYIKDSEKDQKENNENLEEDKKVNEEDEDDFDFDFSFEDDSNIENMKLNVKNVKEYPYNAIGTISVQFPESKEIFEYTCFLIDSNVVVTLAANLENNNKGGKAVSIVTSFSEENVKWENIFIQGEEKKFVWNKSLDDSNSKLAVILYDNIIKDEWLGVEKLNKEDYESRDIKTIFSFREENNDNSNNNNIVIKEENKVSQSKFREILIHKENKFLVAYEKGEKEKLELIKQSPGSPLFYKDYNNGFYVLAIITEKFKFQYFDKETMKFLVYMVNKGKLFRKKTNKNIDEDNIIELNLEEINLGPSDIKYLTTNFNLKNLQILDLNSNSIKSKGVLYLSQFKFCSLKFLNVSNNKIGDEGVNYIVNGFFQRLTSLHLSNNSISSEGIKYLVKAEFINNLIVLSLSDNLNIGDTGIRYIKENKKWNKLKILNLENIGLTDVGLNYLNQATNSMPKLRDLNIRDNKFTDNGNVVIKDLKMKHLYLILKPGDDRKEDDDLDY